MRKNKGFHVTIYLKNMFEIFLKITIEPFISVYWEGASKDVLFFVLYNLTLF